MSLGRRLGVRVLQGARTALGWLPAGGAATLGLGIGRLSYSLARGFRRTALDNLERVFPEMDPTARRQLARRSFETVAASMIDMAASTGRSPDRLIRRVDFQGIHHLDRIGDRGVIFLGAHFGSWEIAMYAVAKHHRPIDVITNVMRDGGVDRDVRRTRERFGVRTIVKLGAARQMYRVVKRGGSVAVAMDQRVRPEQAIDVVFLGVPSLASPIPAFVSIKTGCPVIPVFCLRNGRRYAVEVQAPIEPGESGLEAVAALTQQYIDAIEAEIRKRPEHWLWMYKRWKAWDMSVELRSSLSVDG